MATDKAQELYNKSKAKKAIEKELDAFSMWSFILSFAPFYSLFMFAVPLLNVIGFVLLVPTLIVSIILGILSFGRINKDNKKYGKGFSIAGIVISTISLLVLLINVIAFFSIANQVIY